MGRAQNLFGVGALAVVAKPAGKAVGVAVQRARLGADLALACLAGPFLMNAGFLFRHGELLGVLEPWGSQRPHLITAALAWLWDNAA